MSKRQHRQSTADLSTAKHKITYFFQRNMAETNDGIIEPVCYAHPGGSEVELQDRKLSSPACNECSDKQDVTLVTSPSSCDMVSNHPFQNPGYTHEL